MACPYREWEPLTHLIGRIPQKYQRGLFSTDIQVSSGDVHKNIIALGTNVPTVYLFDKTSGALTQTLKCGKNSDRVTAVVMQESLEVIVAAGTEKGLVYVFQLPSSLPGRCKELKQFVLPHLLKKDVRSICLSVNCLRLFAGDSLGTVTGADIDYDKEECVSEVLLKESATVVQLAYCRGLLLVTTLSQAVLYDCELRSITKIGSQDRKVLGKFGGQFSNGDCRKSDATVYVSRPGYRLWRCDAAGQVKATLVFKEMLDKAPEIQLAVTAGGRLTDQVARGNSSTAAGSAFVDQFGEMLLLGDSRMVMWNDDALYIIDVASSAIVGVCRDVGPLLHVFAKSADEIFLLRTGMQRRLIRLAVASLTPATTQANAAAGASGASTAAVVHGDERTDGGSHGSAVGPPQPAGAAAVPATSSLPVPRPLLDGPLLEHQEPTNAARKLKDVESKLHSGLDNMKKGLSSLMKSTAGAGAQRQPQGLRADSTPLLLLSASGSARSVPLATSARPGGSGGLGTAAAAPVVRSFEDEPELVMRLPVQGPRKVDVGSSTPQQLGEQSGPPVAAACEAAGATDPRESPARTLLAGTPAVDIDDGDGSMVEQQPAANSATIAGSQTERAGSSPGSLRASHEAEAALPLATKVKAVKAKKSKSKKTSEVEVAASQRFRALYDQLASNLIYDVPTIAYPDHEVKDDDGGSSSSSAPAEATVAASASNGTATGDARVQQLQPVSRSMSASNLAADGDEVADAGRAAHSSNSSERVLLLLATAADGSAVVVDGESSALSEQEVSSPVDELAIYDVYHSVDANDAVPSTSVLGAAAAAHGSSSTSDDVSNMPASVPAENVATGSSNQSDTGAKDSSSPRRSVWPMISEQWTEYIAPKAIKCLAACSAYISYVDKDDSIHYSRLKDPGAFEWRKLDVNGCAIALSHSGDVSWRLASDGSAFAGGCRAQVVSPTQIKWTEAVRSGVSSVAVGESAAWYIKEGGRLHIHDGVSKDRPLTRSLAVKFDRALSKVAGRQCNSLLGLTSDGEIFRFDGSSWHVVRAPPNSQGVCDVALGWGDISWVTDCAGSVWFTELASTSKEAAVSVGRHDVSWWQVNYQLNLAPSLRRKDAGQQRLAADKRNKCLVSVAENVVMLSIEPRKTLHIRQGHVVGHQWIPMSFPGIALSARWDMVYTNDSESLWLVQARRELFCYSVSARRMRTVVMPDCHASIRSISGSGEALWVLFDDGRVFVSSASHGTGLGSGGSVLIGLTWTEVDMSQLSEVRLQHVSVGREYVWAVDEFGTVYVRVGAMPKQSRHMSPAWAPVESKLPQMGAHFASIHVSDDGSAVWAVDSKENVFARRGVSEKMPLGLSWVQVIGSPVKQLVLTGDTAWALTSDGEVMCRAGMTSVNITGDYWKILPSDRFKHLTVSLGNYAWAIGAEGQVLEHRCRVVGRAAQQQRRDSELDHDWELV